MRTSRALFLSMALIGLAASGLSALASDAPQVAPADTHTTADVPSPETSAAARDDGDRMICTREKPMGSNFTKRVCRKSSEIDTLRNDTRDALRNGTRPTGIIRQN